MQQVNILVVTHVLVLIFVIILIFILILILIPILILMFTFTFDFGFVKLLFVRNLKLRVSKPFCQVEFSHFL